MALQFYKKDNSRNYFGGKFFREEKLQNFLDKFDIVRCSNCYSSRMDISAKQFINLLQEGRLGRTPYYDRHSFEKYLYEVNIFDEVFGQEHYFNDHSFFWKIKSGKVIYTSIPYATKEMIIPIFERIADKFSFPQTIRLAFLEDKYRFYDVSSNMFCLYDENAVGGLI